LRLSDDLMAIGYNGPNLVLVEAHARQVARVANGQSLYGPAARRESVMMALNRCAQVYFIGHNVFRSPAPADCGLLLAEDRLLTLLDVQQLRLAGARVILSACESSLSTEHGGDWLGLAGAFLQAGAAQVMGTLWPVNEVATCMLMDRFWAAWVDNNTDPLLALRQAQTEIRALSLHDIRQALAAYELTSQAQTAMEKQLLALQDALPGTAHPLDHPYYWAPFMLIGA